ncbi:hypothetical protein LTR74_018233 [Friedmanniomyces endolithicus]|nr:hypothetical protein LTR74_018233 [Friedmanniomyces endolithicus]
MDDSLLMASAFNRIPTFEQQDFGIPGSDLQELAHLYIRFGTHAHWGVGILHRHTTLRNGCVMVHSLAPSAIDTCTMQYAENLQGTPLVPHALHLNDEHKLQAYEYDTGAPRPPLHEDFIRLFQEFAMQRRLGKRIAIVPNSAITRYAALETLVIDSHGEISGMRSAPSKHEAFSAVNTNWSFHKEQDRVHIVAVKACVRQANGLHKVTEDGSA